MPGLASRIKVGSKFNNARNVDQIDFTLSAPAGAVIMCNPAWLADLLLEVNIVRIGAANVSDDFTYVARSGVRNADSAFFLENKFFRIRNFAGKPVAKMTNMVRQRSAENLQKAL